MEENLKSFLQLKTQKKKSFPQHQAKSQCFKSESKSGRFQRIAFYLLIKFEKAVFDQIAI